MRRDDVLSAVLCLAVGLVLLAAGSYVDHGIPVQWFAGPLLLACLGVAVRRARPLLALGLGVVAFTADLAMGPSLGTVLIVTDNLYAAVRYGPRPLGRWMLGITSVIAVVGGAAAGFIARDLALFAIALVQAGLVGVTPVITALVIRQHEDQAASERIRAEQVARLAELDRKTAVQAERTRMARELHDMIANHFSAIAIQSTAVLSRRDLDPAVVRQVLESVRENSVQGMAEMRSMIGLLRQEGEEAEAVRLRVAEADRLAERAREAGLDVRLRVDGEARELPAAVDLAGYRIVQESLTNALKHGGRTAEAVIGYRPEEVVLTVDNPVDGTGPGLPGAGAGLIGMRERAALVGGRLDAGPHGGGWRVRAVLPTLAAPPGTAVPPSVDATASPSRKENP
ncbi:sensor histidine kinase [Planomonospora parontospora]|uniref:sensor histidine kinase n=1 Tax=Planomonospora parontospora TaxID=58119 RepID=UPI001996A32F|nr:histidine kinase [Planomonospora parontospora]GGL56413.1 two-component sensor histidine kinase [Planomonospora parontospora subsp. antibiotica]GII19223.1 two-component sensor histidine kinase [Planomonospora parontospora subsp. antibiotica]